MNIQIVDAHAEALDATGLGGLALPARLGEALRTQVALFGPRRPGPLVAAAVASLRGLWLPVEQAALQPLARRILLRLRDDGDLVNAPDAEDDSLHARPLSFVRASGGRRLLVGACLRAQASIEVAPGLGLRFEGHRRWVGGAAAIPRDVLVSELSEGGWVRAPDAHQLAGAPARAMAELQGAMAMGPLDGVHWLPPGGAAWVPCGQNIPPGLQVLRLETAWGQHRWYLVSFTQGGIAGGALPLPHPALPAADSAHGQAATLHLALSQQQGAPCGWSWQPLPDDRLRLTLTALPPPWLARSLDLRGARDGARGWVAAASSRASIEAALAAALLSPN